MLNKILRMRIKFLGHEHIATGEVMFTVGLVHLYLEQYGEARKHIEAARNIYASSLVRTRARVAFCVCCCVSLCLGLMLVVSILTGLSAVFGVCDDGAALLHNIYCAADLRGSRQYFA